MLLGKVWLLIVFHIRRRKQNRIAAGSTASHGGELLEADGSEVPSASTTSARTAAADTVLDMLEDSDKENSGILSSYLKSMPNAVSLL